MITWVLYDIKKNKPRNYVAKFCKQAGLYRDQYSVFLGTLNANEKDSLALEIEEIINPETDKVYIFVMSKNELSQANLLGQAFDKDLITDQVRALFF